MVNCLRCHWRYYDTHLCDAMISGSDDMQWWIIYAAIGGALLLILLLIIALVGIIICCRKRSFFTFTPIIIIVMLIIHVSWHIMLLPSIGALRWKLQQTSMNLGTPRTLMAKQSSTTER